MSIRDKIYLQMLDNDGYVYEDAENRTHCTDRIRADDVAYIRADKVKRLLQAAVDALRHADRYYLSQSASAEVWSFCSGKCGTPGIVAELNALEGEN